MRLFNWTLSIYANPGIPVHSAWGMRYSYLKNLALLLIYVLGCRYNSTPSKLLLHSTILFGNSNKTYQKKTNLRYPLTESTSVCMLTSFEDNTTSICMLTSFEDNTKMKKKIVYFQPSITPIVYLLSAVKTLVCINPIWIYTVFSWLQMWNHW